MVQRELDPKENVWLSRLRQDLQMERDVEVLARAYRGKDSDPLYSAVMDLIVRANWKMYKEGETVCDALNELFADKLEGYNGGLKTLFGPEIKKAVHGSKELWKRLLDEGISPGGFVFDT